jgi:FkbM family methyltransferase
MGRILMEELVGVPKVIGLNARRYISLDNLLIEAHEPIFIKMDIDGGEVEALQSGTEVLKSKSCLLVVETHSNN